MRQRGEDYGRDGVTVVLCFNVLWMEKEICRLFVNLFFLCTVSVSLLFVLYVICSLKLSRWSSAM